MTEPELAFVSPIVRGRVRDQRRLVTGARDLIAAMCEATDRADLGATDVLDVGCGVKFSQALLTYDLPIGSYTGVDVHPGIVAFLTDAVDDDRFRYLHHDVHNELYNPEAPTTLAEAGSLPVPDASADVVCGFSLFTHLAPHDASAMFEQMRRAVRPDGWLYVTAFLNERSGSGHGYVDRVTAGLDGGDPRPDAVPDYVEGNPDRPLDISLYSRRHLLDLAEAAGWRVVAVLEPVPEAQHRLVARPARY